MKSGKKAQGAATLHTEKQLTGLVVGQETAANTIALSKTNEAFLGDETSLAAGIIMQDGRILQANASFCKKFNLQGEVTTSNLLNCLSVADRRLLERKLRLAQHNGNACTASLHDSETRQQQNWAISVANGMLYIQEDQPKAVDPPLVTHSLPVSSSSSLLEIVPLPALLFNRRHELLMVNQELVSLCGISSVELLTRKAAQIFLKADDSRLRELRTALLEGNLPEIKYQLQLSLPDGETRWMEYAERMLPKGSIPALSEACSIAVLYNIQELKKQEELLQEREEEVGLFVDRASHDLKGPLKSMMSLYKIMEHEFGADPNIMEYVRHYHNGISRLYRILQDMLQMSRLNKGEHQYSYVNLQQMVDECLQSFRNMQGFFSISFLKQVDVPSEVMLEKSLLQTIVQNLLENAIKYSAEENPEVKICIREQDNGIRLEVSDNGIGIPADLQPKIFDRYFRATSKASGSGLGLYLLKQAVDKLKGHVSLNSEEGQGTTFTVYLPYLH